MVKIEALELIHEWALEHGFNVSHDFAIDTKEAKLIIKYEHGVMSIYNGEVGIGCVSQPHRVDVYGSPASSIGSPEYFSNVCLDLREPDFFAKLKEVLTE